MLKTIHTSVLEHKTNGLVVATSDDLPGLYVAATSVDQVAEELPGAIWEMLEAQGDTVLKVFPAERTEVPSGFSNLARVFSVELKAA